jgi:DNA primase
VESPVEQVRAGIDIVDLISQHVSLKKYGRTFKAICPFHNEKTPSFVVFPDTQRWHCFGCGEGGDIFTFLMKIENMTFADALRRLADRIGVVITRPRESEQRKEAHQRLYAANESAAVYYHGLLMNSRSGREYVAGRGITDDTTREFLLGLSSDSSQTLLRTLTGQGFTTDELLEAGLLYQPDEGPIRDRFRGRWMFPIRDAEGHIVSFGARGLTPDAVPKYLNGPDTEIFRKGDVLFGLHAAADAIRREKKAVVVEGYVDAVVAHQGGFKNVVATLGTAITDRHLRQLGRLAPEICLALDPDAAGQNATLRSAEVAASALSRNTTTTVAVMPDGKDPDELILQNPDRWRATIEASRPLLDQALDWVVARYDLATVGGKREAADTISPMLRGITDPLAQAHYLELAAQRLRTTPEALRAHLQLNQPRRSATAARAPEAAPVSAPEAPLDRSQVYAIALALAAAARGLPRIQLDPNDFTDVSLQALAHRAMEQLREAAHDEWRPEILYAIDEPWQRRAVELVSAELAGIERLSDAQVQSEAVAKLRQLRADRLTYEMDAATTYLEDTEPEERARIRALIAEKAEQRASLWRQDASLARGPSTLGQRVPPVPSQFRAGGLGAR